MVTNSLSARQQVILTARQWISLKPVYLDTETTGLDRGDEIVEISIVDHDGQVLLNSLVRPTQSIPASATQIHGITNDMVQKAPAWPILWQQVRPLLIGKTIIAYNSDFDKRMIMQSHARYQMVWRENLTFRDLLNLYAQYRGEWDPQRHSWRYVSLDQAGKLSKIALPNAHRSTADTLLARALLHYLAEQQQ
jgi:DNA polymerase III subunit epsilon